jgi:hypothetical protein
MDLKHLDDTKINFIIEPKRSSVTFLVLILNQRINCILKTKIKILYLFN